MYRKFYLENSNGQTVTLTEQSTKIFLNNPTGLGYSKSITTNQYADALSIVTEDQSFGSVGGEVLFYDSTNQSKYEKFNEFVSFLSYSPLKFYYALPIGRTFYCDVAVTSLDKTEVKTDGFMRCPITLQMLSRWKGEEIVETGTVTSYTLTNDGHMPVGFEITIEGSLENPYFTLSQNNEVYGEAKFNDATAFDSVFVNSKDSEQNVILEQGGSVLANPLSYQDLSISNGSIYVTFVKLARGESTLTIGMDSGSVSNVEIKFTPIYRSV